VWISVKDAVLDDHLQVDPLEFGRQLRPIQAQLVEPFGVGDLDAGQILHCQHTRPTGVVDRLRDLNIPVFVEVAPDLFENVALAGVIHLLADGFGELVGQTIQRKGPSLADKSDQDRDRPPEHFQVGLDQRFDVRSTDLDRDLLALIRGEIHLAQTRAADRVGVELVEHVVDGAEFVFDHQFGLVPRCGRHVVLKARQHVDVGFRQDVGPRRQ